MGMLLKKPDHLRQHEKKLFNTSYYPSPFQRLRAATVADPRNKGGRKN
jgi:hypothetical protein